MDSSRGVTGRRFLRAKSYLDALIQEAKSMPLADLRDSKELLCLIRDLTLRIEAFDEKMQRFKLLALRRTVIEHLAIYYRKYLAGGIDRVALKAGICSVLDAADSPNHHCEKFAFQKEKVRRLGGPLDTAKYVYSRIRPVSKRALDYQYRTLQAAGTLQEPLDALTVYGLVKREDLVAAPNTLAALGPI